MKPEHLRVKPYQARWLLDGSWRVSDFPWVYSWDTLNEAKTWVDKSTEELNLAIFKNRRKVYFKQGYFPDVIKMMKSNDNKET